MVRRSGNKQAASHQKMGTMNHSNPAEMESVLAADLGRAMLATQARTKAEKELPTLTKAELAELLFEQVGLNKREAKDMVETFF